jgi:DNA (cytosine-5)-methyltransferase 1
VIEDRDGAIRPILEIVSEELFEYCGFFHAVEFADYGVPQRRQRLITVLTRDQLSGDAANELCGLVPAPTHASGARFGRKPWMTVEEALAGFPSLDARSKETASDLAIPFHRVPVLDPRKYDWIANTPPGGSAFDNQCVNPDCGFQENPSHGNARVAGINRSRKDTPIDCLQCGTRLPRPTTLLEDGTERLMSGYTSAYKRMRGDLPSPAITRNLSYPCSDHKVHPTENRVLSLAEGFVLQTLASFEFVWEAESEDGHRRKPADTLVRLVLGESVPPRFLRILGEFLMAVDAGERPPAAVGTSMRRLSESQSRDQLTLV